MELYKELLLRYLSNQKMEVTFPDLKVDLNKVVEMRCYQALRAIQAVLEDETLDDADCFQKMEQIVEIFADLGSGGGNRHDFG